MAFCKFKVVRRKILIYKNILQIRKPVAANKYQNIARNMCIYKGASSHIPIQSVCHFYLFLYIWLRWERKTFKVETDVDTHSLLLLRIATNVIIFMRVCMQVLVHFFVIVINNISQLLYPGKDIFFDQKTLFMWKLNYFLILFLATDSK